MHGGLHAGGAADRFARGADDENHGAHVGPMGAGGDEAGDAVGAVGAGAAVPGHVTAEEAAAGGTGALPRDERQLGG